MSVVETATQRIVEQGILGTLLVIAIFAIIYLYRQRENDRKVYDAEKKQMNADMQTLLRETLQRDHEHFDTMKTVLDVVQKVKV